VSSPPADKVQVFRALCWSRASRWKEGAIAAEHDGDGWIGHAVDPLQAWAEQNGLIKAIGQDAVQAIMAEAFANG
jgi:hypothetical protein